jgi:uncharacterized protein YcgI (DUF1989 family)
MKIAERLDVVLEHHLPARTRFAFRVDAGDHIRIVDLQGEQAADFWAFHENDLNEYLSAPHTRIGLMRPLAPPGRVLPDEPAPARSSASSRIRSASMTSSRPPATAGATRSSATKAGTPPVRRTSSSP